MSVCSRCGELDRFQWTVCIDVFDLAFSICMARLPTPVSAIAISHSSPSVVPRPPYLSIRGVLYERKSIADLASEQSTA